MNPNLVTVKAIKTGEDIQVMVTGGVIRRKSVMPGLSIETPEGSYFVSVVEIIQKLKELDFVLVTARIPYRPSDTHLK